jgi:DNA polymerase-4
VLTRNLTPPQPPASLQELADLACALRERVGLPSRTRYRLVGVGLSGFVDADRLVSQPELFGGS